MAKFFTTIWFVETNYTGNQIGRTGEMQNETDTTGWHRAEIRAAVEKRGKNLKQLAEDNDLHPAACQRAVAARNTPGERAIAEFLGVPLWVLWPDRWKPPADEGQDPERIDHRRKPH